MATQVAVANGSVTETEVKKFMFDKNIEREFLAKLQTLVRQLELDLGEKNRLVRSMNRFMVNYR